MKVFNNNRLEKFELKVGNKKDKVNLSDLSFFLNNINEIYSYAYVYAKHRMANGRYVNLDIELKDFIYFINKEEYKFPIDFSNYDIESLEFDSITTNSPLKFIGYCTGIAILALSLSVAILALSLSVAIAGGKVDLKKSNIYS